MPASRSDRASAIPPIPPPTMATLMVTSSGAAPRSAPARRPHQARRQLDALRERYARLTARERKVMTLVVAGHLNKEIASEVATNSARFTPLGSAPSAACRAARADAAITAIV